MNGVPQAFHLPKAGSSDADYEDAFAIAEPYIAIADGATESSFARAWAEALVQGFTSAEPVENEQESAQAAPAESGTFHDLQPETPPEPSVNLGSQGEIPIESATSLNTSGEQPKAPMRSVLALQRRIAPLQRAWHDRIAWDRLPWFAEDKARSGAFAALLTFRFEPNASTSALAVESPTGGTWRAMAIGDSCLFQIRDDALRVAFPMEQAEQFNSRPILLSSNPANNDRVWEAVAEREGDYRPGDVFLFATDALAHWILAESEAGRRPWQTLCALRSEGAFAALIALLRKSRAMRNDDVTLVRFTVPAAGPADTLEADEADEEASDPQSTGDSVPESDLPDVAAPAPAHAVEAGPEAEAAGGHVGRESQPALVEAPDVGGVSAGLQIFDGRGWSQPVCLNAPAPDSAGEAAPGADRGETGAPASLPPGEVVPEPEGDE